MRYYDIVNGPEHVPAVILGCMRMAPLSCGEAREIISSAFDLGINYFDHADIYGGGASEERFAEAFRETGLRREDVFIQSKCAIRLDREGFDWSEEYILQSVEGILRRLETDYLDVLLLHRPDLLFEPEEVAAAFDRLQKDGKVRFFGLSNTMPMQAELLRKYVKQPLLFNQLQLSLEQSQLLDQSLYMNDKRTDMSLMRDGEALNYCRLHDMTIQTWSPLQKGMFGGAFIDDPELPELNEALAEVAAAHEISRTAAAFAWILRHPARMMAIAGTMNPAHLKEIAKAADVTLTRREWYGLYLASGKFLP